MAVQVYSRRLSGEEVEEKFIFITKEVFGKLPILNTKFNLVWKDQEYQATISAVSCDCTGTWHEHYHLKADDLFEKNDFKKGTQIELFRIDSSSYLLKAKK
jgi:hypothetical protein